MIDLHCHTNVSDNSMSVREVMQLAKQSGIKHLAITDHDTTKGLQEALRIGADLGIEVIPGIEISAYDFTRKTRAHILGLFVEPLHQALEQLCNPIVDERQQASRQMVQKIVEAGYSITWPQVELLADGGTGVYKQHIMQALIDNGYCEEIYGDLYKTLFSRGEKGAAQGIAYIPLAYVDAVLAIRAIRSAGGVPVLAHPGQFNNYEAVSGWVEAGLQGIEAFHPCHSKDDEEKSLRLAEQFGLAVTGGSDFHGAYGSYARNALGCGALAQNHLNAVMERNMRNLQ